MEQPSNSGYTSVRIVPESDPCGVHPNVVPERTAGAKIIALGKGDEAINRDVARFQDDLEEWNYRSIELAPIVRRLRVWSKDLWERFVPMGRGGRRIEPPPLLLCFAWESPRVLGHYQPGRNNTGFKWEISLNPRNLVRRSEIEVASTLLHEILHCFEDLTGTAPRSSNNYHSAWFRKTAEGLGVPCTRYGHEMGIRDPSPFLDWGRERGLTANPITLEGADEFPPVRAVKRLAWRCSCPDGIRVTVHVARGSELRARCEWCWSLFEPTGRRNALG